MEKGLFASRLHDFGQFKDRKFLAFEQGNNTLREKMKEHISDATKRVIMEQVSVDASLTVCIFVFLLDT